MKFIENCPVCNNSSFEPFLEAKDFLVTKEKFKIVECKACGFHFTNPIPLEEKIGEYYKSEKYVSHNSNRKGLINFIYNIVRHITLRSKVKIVRNETEGEDLLDIGSGSGHFLKVANEKGFNGMGIEPSEEARAFAHSKNGVRSVTQEDLFQIEKKSFDVITMWHVLEHVYDLESYLKTINKILKNNGRLIIAVPNMNAYDSRHYKSNWAAYDVPRHLYHFRKTDISRLLLNHGFELKKVIPMRYDAYYISMLSEKYRSKISLFGIIIGFISNRKARKYGYSSQIYVFDKGNTL